MNLDSNSKISNRFVFLDGLRGIAALFVVIIHTPRLWQFSLYRGYLAVDLFFILSGFMIGFGLLVDRYVDSSVRRYL